MSTVYIHWILHQSELKVLLKRHFSNLDFALTLLTDLVMSKQRANVQNINIYVQYFSI